MLEENAFVLSSLATAVILAVGVQMWFASRLFLMATPMFMAAGVFAATAVTVVWELPLWVAVAFAGGVTLVLAGITGKMLLHLDGINLALASLALSELLRIAGMNLPVVTGGPAGRVVPSTVGPATMLVVMLVTLGVSAWMQSGRRGIALSFLRHDPRVAGSMGLRVQRTRWLFFVTGAFVTGMAGAFTAHYVRFVAPQEYGFAVLLAALAAAVIGGRFHWSGALLGGGFVILLPEVLRGAGRYSGVIVGIAMMVVLVYWSGGLVGPTLKLLGRLRSVAPRALRTPSAPDVPTIASGPSPDDLRSILETSPIAGQGDAGLRRRALLAQDVSFSYGGVRAVADVTLDVEPGRVLGVLGPNGAGKTTLLNLCSGMIRPDTGTVAVNGHNPRTPEEFAQAGLRRTFQRAQFPPELTVLDNVKMGLALAGHGGDDSDVELVMSYLRLNEVHNALPSQLPLGRRRLIELARALVARPTVLLLDEPTSGADEASIELVAETIGLLARAGGAVVVVSHDVPFVSKVADEITVMSLGQVIATLPAEELTEHPAVKEAYLGQPPGRQADDAPVTRTGLQSHMDSRPIDN